MVLGVVLQLLGRDGRAEEVLQVLEHVLLGGRKGARLRVLVEAVLAGGDGRPGCEGGGTTGGGTTTGGTTTGGTTTGGGSGRGSS